MILVLVVALGASYTFVPTIKGEVDWAFASTKNTRESYVAYKQKHPKRLKRVEQANIMIEDIDWQFVKKDSTNRTLVLEYLNAYPEGRHQIPANRMLEDIDWNEIKNDSSEQKIDNFIERHPESSRIPEVMQLQQSIKNKR